MQEKSQNQPEPLAESKPLPRKEKVFTEIYDWFESAVLTVVAVVLIFTFVARTSVVSGSSMVPTLENGEMLLISRLGFAAEPGDVIVLTSPAYEDGIKPLVKRIIAREGQSVNIDFVEGVVYVNGEPLEEPYVNSPTNRSFDVKFPVTVPEGKIFVMGDNRNGSLDSRSTDVGFVDERFVMGKVWLRVFPFGKLGNIDS